MFNSTVIHVVIISYCYYITSAVGVVAAAFSVATAIIVVAIIVIILFSLFCPLPFLRGVLELAPRVSNVLIILSTSISSWSARVCP